GLNSLSMSHQRWARASNLAISARSTLLMTVSLKLAPQPAAEKGRHDASLFAALPNAAPLVPGAAGRPLAGTPRPSGGSSPQTSTRIGTMPRTPAHADEAALAALLRRHAEPLPALDDPEFAAAFDRFGDARVVLVGEASHGSSEFYRARAAISRRLIE